MRTYRIPLILIAALVLIPFAVPVSGINDDAFVRSTQQSKGLREHNHGAVVHAEHDHLKQHVHPVIDEHDKDRLAIRDMHDAAVHHFGVAHEHPESFGTSHGWTSDWTLRWIDYYVRGGTARVYHITSHHNSDV